MPMLYDKENSNHFPQHAWKEFICCPNCGTKYTSSDTLHNSEGSCSVCHCPWKWEDNALTWGTSANTILSKKWKVLFKKLKNQLNLTSSCLLPFRYLTHISVEKYYNKTLSDHDLAKKWNSHYLKDLNLNKGDLSNWF
jgi:hypothetical protein